MSRHRIKVTEEPQPEQKPIDPRDCPHLLIAVVPGVGVVEVPVGITITTAMQLVEKAKADLVWAAYAQYVDAQTAQAAAAAAAEAAPAEEPVAQAA